jgi:hypothetical protein
LNCDPAQFIDFIYPTLYELKPSNPAWGLENEHGFLSKPIYFFLTASSLDLSSVYLLSGWKG